MLSTKHEGLSNPLMIQATLNAIERRRERESNDAVRLAERCGFTPDDWQADVLRSTRKQMILLCSRQSGKSTVTSLLGLHAALYEPGLILLLSPSLRQSQELFRKLKEAYSEIPDAQASEESSLRMEFSNGARIVCLPGNEATIRGFSAARLLIIDEASRVSDALYQAVRPMIAVSGGKIILLSTPFGERGFFHHEWTNGGDEWHRAKITAYDCPRISKEWLDAERAAIGDWWFRQEYLCEFVASIDQVFATEDVHAALDAEVKPLWG